MTQIRPRRSALYLPASNARAIEKARTLDCDVVILDLEDAVAPEQKASARDAAVAKEEVHILQQQLDQVCGRGRVALR